MPWAASPLLGDVTLGTVELSPVEMRDNHLRDLVSSYTTSNRASFVQFYSLAA